MKIDIDQRIQRVQIKLQNDIDQRIQRIQNKMQEERALVSSVDSNITDNYLKNVLNLALSELGDVEYFFLNPEILREPRTAAAFGSWLGQAEKVLQLAVQQREFVEDIVKKLGANARATG
jgi:hypothetical protein